MTVLPSDEEPVSWCLSSWYAKLSRATCKPRLVTAIDRYLIDRTALIDIPKEIEPISSQIREWLAGPDEVGTCGVVVAEFFAITRGWV